MLAKQSLEELTVRAPGLDIFINAPTVYCRQLQLHIAIQHVKTFKI